MTPRSRRRAAREVAAQATAERQRQALQQNFGDITIPRREASALINSLAAPDGTSVREAAATISASRGTTHRYLTRLRLDGHAEIRGRGRAARFILTAPGQEAAPQSPRLRLVEAAPDDDQTPIEGDAQ